MKIGVSIYSFSQYIASGKLDIFSAIKKAAEMGFEAIEFTDIPKVENREDFARKIREEAERNNIEISAYVVGGNLLCEDKKGEVERIKKEIDIAEILGVKLFRYDVVYKLPQYKCFYDVAEEVTESMRELASYGEEHGIKTMIENHGQAFQDADRIEKIYHAVNHKNFGILVDIGNFMCADEDAYKSVSRLANLAVHVHLKDFVRKDFYSKDSKENCFATRGCNYLLGTSVGAGDAKAEQSIEVLKSVGFDGYMDIEFEGPNDCVEELGKSLAFVKKVIS